MATMQLLTAALLSMSSAMAPAIDQKFTYIALKDKANQKLKEKFHNAIFEENHLGELKTGKQTLAEIPFMIGEGCLQLGSTKVTGFPAKIEGVSVDRTFKKLHILHAAGYQSEIGAIVGYYVIHYADKTTEKIEIAYGRDLNDWWAAKTDKAPEKAVIAWEGDNADAKKAEKKIRLYMSTWNNPHPKQKVISIDLIAADNTASGIFLVGLTAED
jgi:hypothetical protein